jgi:hypothetical protein
MSSWQPSCLPGLKNHTNHQTNLSVAQETSIIHSIRRGVTTTNQNTCESAHYKKLSGFLVELNLGIVVDELLACESAHYKKLS